LTAPAAPSPKEGRHRVVLENVSPVIENGRFPVKRVRGEVVCVEMDVLVDGHDHVAGVLRYRHESSDAWQDVPMRPLGNDRWQAEFTVTELGRYHFTAEAWVDHFGSWSHDLSRRPEEDPDLPLVFRMGADMVRTAAARAPGPAAGRLQEIAAQLEAHEPLAERRKVALSAETAELMSRYAERAFVTRLERDHAVTVDRELARFSAWYEFFPRSCTGDRHGRFRDCEAMLAYVAAMGFDVVYLPPIHPIGETYRKGRNNTLAAGRDDVGSPWAIGGRAGGHKHIHPDLGTIEDFRRFRDRAGELGMELALDIAFQCSPDHPYIKEHPEWFRHRPDGSIQYAENPPKKYQDIYPFDFESADWQGLWTELASVVRFWIDQGVRIFRVDNPHTKAFPFWEWLIAGIQQDHPDTLFLAEAFTRPKVMHRLAKLGFSQSYTYFTWRNTKGELIQYFTELHHGPGREYFRPHVWPNTPDILSEYLQFGGRPAFLIRLVLAATLSAGYGIYGPAFELAEGEPRDPGSEEYRDSEKYQLRQWDLERPDSLRDYITRLNRVRRENPALQRDAHLRFHDIDNDKLIAYSKSTDDGSNVLLAIVNLDPHHVQSGWLELPPDLLGLAPEQPYQAHDLISDARYLWYGSRNYVELDPHASPAHLFRLRRRVRREHDFDYFL